MKNQSEHYDEYYNDVEKSAPFIDSMTGGKNNRMDLVIGIFRKAKAEKILEVGCGPGIESKFFMDNGFEVSGCDISKKVIDYAKKKNPGPKYFVHDFEKSGTEEKFDAIYASEVIEHVFDYDAFLKNIHMSLGKDGIVFMTTPNVIAPRNRIKLLFGKDNWFRDKYHVHFFSPSMLKESLERNGFTGVKLMSGGRISFLGPNFGGCLMAVARK